MTGYNKENGDYGFQLGFEMQRTCKGLEPLQPWEESCSFLL